MATGVLIIGQSGTGKSTSISTLNPTETTIINVVNKPLPFKGWKAKYQVYNKETRAGNMLSTDQSGVIHKFLQHIDKNMPHIKNVVIDDMQYVMANEYMRRSKENGFGKFTDIAKGMFDIVQEFPILRDDLIIYCMFHAEIDTDALGNKLIKAKTIGKMFDSYVTLEGLFSIVLYTNVKKTEKGLEYTFVTQNSGNNTAKSPVGMFETMEIPNDLQYVSSCIREYELAA